MSCRVNGRPPLALHSDRGKKDVAGENGMRERTPVSLAPARGVGMSRKEGFGRVFVVRLLRVTVEAAAAAGPVVMTVVAERGNAAGDNANMRKAVGSSRRTRQ